MVWPHLRGNSLIWSINFIGNSCCLIWQTTLKEYVQFELWTYDFLSACQIPEQLPNELFPEQLPKQLLKFFLEQLPA